MCQTEMIQASIQMEAAQELKELVRPLVRRIFRSTRSRRLTNIAPEVAQPQVTLQSPADPNTGRVQV
jgi:hypothetical protein